MFSLICAWTKGWVNNREACDLRRRPVHHDVTVMGFATSGCIPGETTKCNIDKTFLRGETLHYYCYFPFQIGNHSYTYMYIYPVWIMLMLLIGLQMFVIYCVRRGMVTYGSIRVQLTRTVFLSLSNVGYMMCTLSSGVVDYMTPQGPVSSEKLCRIANSATLST